MDNLVYARDNAMVAGTGVGGGMSGRIGSGGKGLYRMGIFSNFFNLYNSSNQNYASSMQNMFGCFMQMMGGANPNGNPFANMQRVFL